MNSSFSSVASSQSEKKLHFLPKHELKSVIPSRSNLNEKKLILEINIVEIGNFEEISGVFRKNVEPL